MSLKITEEQKLIINAKVRRAEVLAVAGSGKTSTAEMRINRLLKTGVKANEFLILTFSKAAVKAIGDKVSKQLEVKTFHAFSVDLLTKHYSLFGFKKLPKLMTHKQQLKLVKKVLKACKAERKALTKKAGFRLTDAKHIERMLAFFDSTQGSKNRAAALLNDQQSDFHIYKGVIKSLSTLYSHYRVLKKKEGLIDYVDMLRYGRKIVEEGRGVARYRYLFVDESQDMNHGQALLLKALAVHIPNVMVFGDPHQAIFGFAGGQHWKLETLMKGVKSYQLTHSFRLVQPIADLASALIAPLTEEPIVIKARPSKSIPKLIESDTLYEQTQAVVQTIKSLCKPNQHVVPTIAVLARTKAELREIEIALIMSGYSINPLYRKSEAIHLDAVVNMLALLERLSETGIVTGKGNIEKLNKSILIAAGFTKEPGENVINGARRMLVKLIDAPTLEGRYIQMSKIYTKLFRAIESDDKDMKKELGLWVPFSREYSSVIGLRRAISKVRQGTSVTLSSIHKVKGLEYDHVLVLGLTDGSLPFYKDMQRGDVSEERRLLYVAVTRARKRLFLFHAPYCDSQSRKIYKEPSQFLTPSVRKCLVHF